MSAEIMTNLNGYQNPGSLRRAILVDKMKSYLKYHIYLSFSSKIIKNESFGGIGYTN